MCKSRIRQARTKVQLFLAEMFRSFWVCLAPRLQVTVNERLYPGRQLQKLWKAAYVFHAEGSLEADLWVLDRTLRILLGGVSQVVKGIRQSVTKRGLSGPKRKTLTEIGR